VSLARTVRRATLCNLVEEDLQNLPAAGTKLTVPLTANGVATVRLEVE